MIDGEVFLTPSDLSTALACEYAVLRRLDYLLGFAKKPDLPRDDMLIRLAALGESHEDRHLEGFKKQFGTYSPDKTGGVVSIQVASKSHPHDLSRGQELTLTAVQDRADVIHQAVMFGDGSIGFADFLLLDNEVDQYTVADAKLARQATVSAALQVSAYADYFSRLGCPVSATGQLLLGDDTYEPVVLSQTLPVLAHKRMWLTALVAEHRELGTPVSWKSEVGRCGRCDECELAVAENRDPLMVAGVHLRHRGLLREAQVTTIDDLANTTDEVPGINNLQLATMRRQASLQLQQESAGETAGLPNEVLYELRDRKILTTLPVPDPGDMFFDFEGDPMWRDPQRHDWGLEYLFGWVQFDDDEPKFHDLWALNRQQEAQALRDFLDHVVARLRDYPEMHIYHYARYEQSALLRLAARHGYGEELVDDLLRRNVFVDLYPIVKGSVFVSQPSYGLKKLEPLFMEARTEDLQSGSESIEYFAAYCDALALGDQETATKKRDDIAQYNHQDCEATRLLRDWLLARATDEGVNPSFATLDPNGLTEAEEAEAGLVAPLLKFAERRAVGQSGPTPEQVGAEMVAGSVGFHRREAKPYWWGHYARLKDPTEMWEHNTENALVLNHKTLTDWQKTGRQRNPRRTSQLEVNIAVGSQLERDTEIELIYEPARPGESPEPGMLRTADKGTINARQLTEDQTTLLEVEEMCPTGLSEFSQSPLAISVSPGPRTGPLQGALAEVAEDFVQEAPGQGCHLDSRLKTPLANVLFRQAPALLTGDGLPPVFDGDYISTITQALVDLDSSTLCVQGPPGSGKTYLATHVIVDLMNRGWKIGIVSQTHAVVNQILRKICEMAPDLRVAKKSRAGEDAPWLELNGNDSAEICKDDDAVLIGGTAWDFTNANRIPRGTLDLLIVDEAGQFSLANTLAVSVAAKRMLLVGDPQQLPQVSQGIHPVPVDESALDWLSTGRILDPKYGYFLAETYRMRPELTTRVSHHSYEDRLTADASTQERHLSGSNLAVAGVVPHPLIHHNNATVSEPEAEYVLNLAQELLGLDWQDGIRTRPLGQSDILVVAPYNGQVDLIERRLAQADLEQVRVGTVDRFQGQQAAVVIVSMTASSAEDAPRGAGFVLNPNRLNVAVSRAQWAAHVIYSPELATHTPRTIDDLYDIGRFLELVRSDPTGSHEHD